MATESATTKAVTQAAREVLRPLGLAQQGRSRTWLDDHGWWVIVVEFQPLGYSPGSYLNVGACWLWQPTSEDASLHFDEGHRVERSFTTYDSDEQFRDAATGLAVAASHEVLALRKRFDAPAAAVRHLERKVKDQPTDPRAAWNLAMGLAFVGRLDDARSVARRDLPPGQYEWVVNLQREIAQLGLMADDELRAAAMANITATRANLRLDPWEPSIET